MDYDVLRRLIALVEENGLTELTVEENGFMVRIKAEEDSSTPQAFHVIQQQAACTLGQTTLEMEHVESAVGSGESVLESEDELLYKITSPMIGVFYRCPSPDSPPYVEIGDLVEPGQTIGLIEAMKVFSEVPAEHGGRVVAIPAENGKLVQQGDVLVVIDTSQTE